MDATTRVEVPVGRARELLLGDPLGIVRPPHASPVGGAVELEVGQPRPHDDGLRVPVLLWSPAGGPLQELTADLTVGEADDGSRLDLRGTYRWAPGPGYGGGVLAHRVARWLAIDLVNGAAEQLLARDHVGC